MSKDSTTENIVGALIVGSIAAVVCAGVWGIIAAVIGYVFGWLAIGVGSIVGVAIKVSGNSNSQFSGVIAAILALLGVVLGNFFCIATALSTVSIEVFGTKYGFLQSLGVMIQEPQLAIAVF
ncbi:MAG: hypothetical protein LBJ67_08745 [Planctomycetaceae bacterium]|jgi:hypothetical protein|nr:hypothetical protein [Planctomycetaceae bacterium]